MSSWGVLLKVSNPNKLALFDRCSHQPVPAHCNALISLGDLKSHEEGIPEAQSPGASRLSHPGHEAAHGNPGATQDLVPAGPVRFDPFEVQEWQFGQALGGHTAVLLGEAGTADR